MANVNKVILIGTLTRDPEIKYTPKGTAVANISLAINRTWNNDAGEKQEEVAFIDIDLWGRVAEIVEEYCKKGKPLYVEGRLKLDTWEDKKSGEKRSKLKVVGENIQLLNGRERQESGDSSESERPARSFRKPAAPPPRPPADPDLDADGDDIPF